VFIHHESPLLKNNYNSSSYQIPFIAIINSNINMDDKTIYQQLTAPNDDLIDMLMGEGG